MTQKDLHERARRQPFEPFRVILTTGATYDIRHPDLIMVGLRFVIIGLPRTGNGPFESTLRIDLLDVVVIEQLPGFSQSPDVPAA